MPLPLLVLVAFACAAALDLVAIAWHRAREGGHVMRGTALAMVHEALAWGPVVLALELGSAPSMALAAVAGVGVANALALRRSPPRVPPARVVKS